MNKILMKILMVFKKLTKSKNLKYSTITVVMVCVVAAIAIVFNMLVGMANIKWDLTPNKLYTIGDTTKEILENLENDVVVYGLFDEEKLISGDEYKDVVYLLEQYDRYPRVSVEYIDLERTPNFVAEVDPDNVMDLKNRQFVIMSGDKKKKLEKYDLFSTQADQYGFNIYLTGSDAEQGFTGAVKYVTAEVTPTIYYTQGHGEVDVERYYGVIMNFLERNNYDVKPLDLLIEEKVPEDATLVMFISPGKDITIEERDKVEVYLKNDGGRVMFLFDPVEGNVSFSEFNKLLSEFNVAVNNDLIFENNRNMHIANSQQILIPEIRSNSINYDLRPDTFKMVLPGARSIETLKNIKEYIETTSLVVTSDEAESRSTESEDKSRTGEFDLAVGVEYKGGYELSKVLVMGNSTFMSDAAYQRYGPYGIYYFMNSLYWMHDEKDDLFIAPKYYQSQILSSITETQKNVFTVLLAVVLPLLILGMGTFVYLRRRHL